MKPLGYGYICRHTAGTATAATRYRQDIENYLRRMRFDVAGVLVDDDNGDQGLDTIIAMADNPENSIAVVVVPSLNHLRNRLQHIASHVTVLTLYPEQRWETTAPKRRHTRSG